MIVAWLEKMFGPNWQTALYGFLGGVGAFFSANIELLDPLPDYWEGFFKQLLAFLMAAGIFQLGRTARDKNVSGVENIDAHKCSHEEYEAQKADMKAERKIEESKKPELAKPVVKEETVREKPKNEDPY